MRACQMIFRLNPLLLLAAMLVGGLQGCGKPEYVSEQVLAPIAPPPSEQPLAKPTAGGGPLGSGLIKAPSSEQVIESFPVGRDDPFLPVQEAVALSQEQIKAKIKDLQVNGIVRVAGRIAIFVTFQGSSGEVYLGEVGGKSTVFLPSGWRLAAIHVDEGRIEITSQKLKAFIYL